MAMFNSYVKLPEGTMKNKVHVITKYYEEMNFFRSNHVLTILTSG